MGFWSTVGKFALDTAKSAGKEVMNASREMQEKKMQYQSYSDERLASIYWGKDGLFGNSGPEKLAAGAVLRERYGDDAKNILTRYK